MRYCVNRDISTHAPAGGATGLENPVGSPEKLFLLTPLREGRQLCQAGRSLCDTHFYSRPCGRGDSCGMDLINPSTSISTHAPAGGATEAAIKNRNIGYISTHAPAGGATLRSGQCKPMQLRFLLTPLREGRRGLQVGRKGGSHFYSRPCGRGDKRGGRKGKFGAISTHAPAGGATRGGMRQNESHENFYSRPCGRGDRLRGQVYRLPHDFYSRPCGRGDILTSLLSLRSIHFYSRPCGRGD